MWIGFEPIRRVSPIILRINLKFWQETRFLKPRGLVISTQPTT